MQKDTQEEKLKLVIIKLTTYLKQKVNLSTVEVNKLGHLTKDELKAF